MRSSLRNPIAQRGERKPSRLRIIARRAAERGDPALQTVAELQKAQAGGEIVATRACEAEVQRVRAAGGPVDEAVYVCSCGYCFAARVSTTVPCPHCGATQAW
jgi:rubrerythrin